MTSYMSARQASDQNNARIAYENLSTQYAEMQKTCLRKEAETSQLQLSIKTAELALAQKEAERIGKLAAAYNNERGSPSAPDPHDSGSRERATASYPHLTLPRINPR